MSGIPCVECLALVSDFPDHAVFDRSLGPPEFILMNWMENYSEALAKSGATDEQKVIPNQQQMPASLPKVFPDTLRSKPFFWEPRLACCAFPGHRAFMISCAEHLLFWQSFNVQEYFTVLVELVRKERKRPHYVCHHTAKPTLHCAGCGDGGGQCGLDNGVAGSNSSALRM